MPSKRRPWTAAWRTAAASLVLAVALAACGRAESSGDGSAPGDSTAPAAPSAASLPSAALAAAPDSARREGGASAAPAGASPAVAGAAAGPGASAGAAPPSSSAARRFVVLAGGDVSLARELGQDILREPSAVRPFAALGPLIEGADLTFVNLESQLSDQGGETQSPHNRLVFTAPPAGADVLAHSGIDVVSLANNHMWDYGKRAFFSTLTHLEAAGVAYVGASRTPERMYEPLVLRRGEWSIALFAVTQIWNQGHFPTHEGSSYVAWARFDRLAKLLETARKEHDVVLVSYHGGSEYLDMPMAFTREYVEVVMRWGADAVIGHHPHVPHGVGWHGDRPAFYSLGNLVFGMHRDHVWTGTGFLARLTFERPAGCAARECTTFSAEACPYHILGTTPLPFTGSGRPALERAFGEHLRRISKTVGGTELGASGADGCMPLSAPVRPKSPRGTPSPAPH